MKYHIKQDPEINVGCIEKEDGWLFNITDNGMGIDMRYAKTIFSPFRRLDPDGMVKGHGMGLAICKKIAEMHGGKLWFEPRRKQGTRFFFFLPNQLCATDNVEVVNEGAA